MTLPSKNFHFSHLLDNCKEAFLFCDTDGKVIYFNKSYELFITTSFGSTMKEMCIVHDLFPDPIRPRHQKLHQAALKGETQAVEFSNQNPAGLTSYFEISLAPVSVKDSIVGVLEIIKEITSDKNKQNELERNFNRLEKQISEEEAYYLDTNIVLAKEIAERNSVEEKLKENEERLAQIIHGNSIPTFVIDHSHTITHWNKACEKLTGLLGADMIGTKDQWKPFYLYKRPTIADLVLDRAEQKTFLHFYGKKYRKSSLLSEAFEAEDYFDFREVGKWLFFSAAPLRNISGEIIGAIETLQDITDRKEMEQKIRDYHKILESRIEERTEQLKITYNQLLHAEKLSAVGKLAASIAHEFGNPIIGIRNFLKALQKSSSIEKGDAEVIDLAVQECQRVKDLISNLQNFNRPTSGTIAPMDLHKAIDDMLLFCKKNMKERQIQVVKKYAKNLPLIHTVSDQIKQVILNCLNNAAESIKEDHGTITLKTEAHDDKILLHISDTGRGIKDTDIDYIFEPFFSTKPAVEGTGLGLSVSYGIIKRHCGDIEVTATSRKGTTFTITLPIKVSG